MTDRAPIDEFGDAEPEDAWHPDDPIPDLIANLIRRRDRDLRHRIAANIRADLFDDDLRHVLARIADELEP